MIKENKSDIETGSIDIFGSFKTGKIISELRVKHASDDPLEAIPGKRVYLYAFHI